MKVALIEPPNLGNLVRGVGFYTRFLYGSLSDALGDEINLVKSSFTPLYYRKYDLVHFPYFDPYFLSLPPLTGRPTVVTVHDLIPVRFKKHFPPGIKGELKWQIQKLLLKRTGVVIADSLASKNDIIDFAGISESKIAVVYPAVDPRFKVVKDEQLLKSASKKFNLPDRFVLYVGGVNWNKNLPTLIRACQTASVHLVIVGKEILDEHANLSHPENKSLREALSLIGTSAKIHCLGYVPTEDLVSIYNLAECYIQPSIYEGFGLPVLEALSCGSLVICGKNSSLVEIASDVAMFTNIENAHDLVKRIENVVSLSKTERSRLVSLGLKKAKEFTWEKAASKVINCYRSLV